MAAHYQARSYQTMAAVSEAYTAEDPEFGVEGAAAEIRAALRLTRRRADIELGFALDLSDRLPRVFQALSAGDIDLRRARTIEQGTSHLDEDTARRVVEQVIEGAPRLTTGQLAARIRRLCVTADPEEAKQRYEETLRQRRTTTEANETGTANLLGLDLAPEWVTAASNRINQMARSLKTKTESRTMDQLRADVFLDLLLLGTAEAGGSNRGVVDIHVDLETLARLSDAPGDLAGYGPVIADIARQVTHTQTRSEWRWTVTHPETGQTLHNGTTRRRPTAAQRRQVQSHNRTCIFPGCRMPATACDLDHAIPHAQGGPTTTDNLPPVCRHDHVTRHRHNWKHQPLPNGDHQWTSPLGHTYTTSGLPP